MKPFNPDCAAVKIMELALELDKVKRDNEVLREQNRKLFEMLENKKTKEYEEMRASRPVVATVFKGHSVFSKRW